MNVWAVVPVKNLGSAKQRLSPVLDQQQRRSLLCAMLRDVLSALTRADCLAGIMLVTRDQDVRAIAGEYAVSVLEEDENRGHTDAVTFGANTLAGEGVASMLTLPADLPLVAPADIHAIVSAHPRTPPAVTLAPARDNLGSNAMLCSPPDVLPFRFGENSFYPHLQRVRELGIEPRIIERQGLGLDIDTPDDLRTFAAQRSSTCAFDYLSQTGLIDVLAGSSQATP